MKKLQGRFFCWDDKLIESENDLQIIMHKPEKKDIAVLCDEEWEGECNGYSTILKTPDGYKFYYRATVFKNNADGSGQRVPYTSVFCVADSLDGKTFTKPNLGLFEYNGTKENNIVWADYNRKSPLDSFSIMYDENPDCPADEKYKAFTECWVKMPHGHSEPRLMYMSSADGYHFVEKYPIVDVAGTMDSYNPVFWDKATEQYFLYHRAFHDPDGTDHLTWAGVDDKISIRDVRLATSKDFVHWTVHGRITFEEGQEDYPLYTSQITKYYRSENMFIGMPTRYCDRVDEPQSFLHMPLSDYRAKITEHYGREGTALTDCIIMTSENGKVFDRRDEAFFTPGPENSTNWWYGNCYPGYGFIETKADERGAANEISMYMGENYRIKKVNFRRYTLRLDGFFSWFAKYRGSEVLTKEFEVAADTLFLNFATSARGAITVSVCDLDGNEIEGYKSYVIFGDSVKREVEFEKPLSELHGKAVRLKFFMSDAHIYSFEVI